MLGARMYKGNDGLVFPLTIPERERPDESVVKRTSGGFARMRTVQGEYKKAAWKGDMVALITGGEESGIGSRADEAAKNLVSRYGLPAESVVSIGGQGNTLGNAAATVEYISSHHEELGDVDTVEIVTNDYHMLRAWVLFSMGMLKAAGGTFAVSKEDQERVAEYLDAGLLGDWNARRIKDTRETVMRILESYFTVSKVKIEPVVAEEMFELAGREGNRAKGKYAALLRNNAALQEVLRSEYTGIKQLLDGTYEGKL